MSNIYKINLTWTSPLVEYAPSGAWLDAVSGQNDSTASFSFTGNGFKWFGAANASTYAIQLNGQHISAQPRKYQQVTEGPTDVYCNETLSWGCMVLAESYNLSAGVEHIVQLTTGFGRNATGDVVNLLAVQTLYDTPYTSDVVQSNEVQMDDSRLVYAGEWNNITYDPLVYRVSKTPGSTISFQFKGYSIQLWGTTDISQSPFTVSLDGHSQNVSLPTSGSTDADCLFWYSAGLDETVQHAVVVTNTGSSGLVIKGFSFDQLIDPDDPGGNENTGQSTPQSLPPSTIAGIVIGIVALISILGISTFFYIKKHRAVQVEAVDDGGNASTTSTLLSLRPLLGGNRSRSRTQISPWSETPDDGAGLRDPQSPDQPSPITPTPLTPHNRSAKQARLGISPLASGSSQTPSTEQPSNQPQDELSLSRRPSVIRIPDATTSNNAIATASVTGIWTGTAQHKPPLHPQSDDHRPTSPTSPTSPLSTITGETGSFHSQPIRSLDLQRSEDHGSFSLHDNTNTAESSRAPGGVERPATPPPAYEAEAESSREGERRVPQRGTSNGKQGRFRVVQND